MQIGVYANISYRSSKHIQRCISSPSFAGSSSSNSIDHGHKYRKLAIKWILSYNKKVEKDTQYLAIVYLFKLERRGLLVGEESWEKISVALLLMASKMNEIYPPKIAAMLLACQQPIKREEVIQTEAELAGALDYEIGVADTVYSLMRKWAGEGREAECEKLLRCVVHCGEAYEFGEEVLALAIVYLIEPHLVKEMRLRNRERVKHIAIKIYNLYQESRQLFEAEKEKENRGS